MAGVHRHRAHSADCARTMVNRIGPWLHVGEAFILVGVTIVLLLTGLLVVLNAFHDLLILTILVLLLGVTLVLLRRHGRSVAE